MERELVSVMLVQELMATSKPWPRSASVRDRTREADAIGVPYFHLYCHPHSQLGDRAQQALPFWNLSS